MKIEDFFFYKEISRLLPSDQLNSSSVMFHHGPDYWCIIETHRNSSVYPRIITVRCDAPVIYSYFVAGITPDNLMRINSDNLAEVKNKKLEKVFYIKQDLSSLVDFIVSLDKC
jgi:hypothetical protein